MKTLKRNKKRKISRMMTIILGIIGVILIGDIVGAIMYIQQEPATQAQLAVYFTTGQRLTLFQIFWQQLLYQFTIWTLGLTIIGNLVNIFLIFVRGVSVGFNLSMLAQEASFGVLLLWLVQYLFIILTTVLSAYFSMRFAYLVVKTLLKKRYDLLKRLFKTYATQLVIIVVLTMVTAIVSSVTTPLVQNQFLASIVIEVEN